MIIFLFSISKRGGGGGVKREIIGCKSKVTSMETKSYVNVNRSTLDSVIPPCIMKYSKF